MKKLFIALCLTLMALPVVAQEGIKVDNSSIDKGFWFAVEAAGMPAFANNGTNAVYTQADVIIGYRFDQFFRVGVGASPRYLFSSTKVSSGNFFPPAKWNNFDLPVYLDLRGNFVSQESKKVVPYWSVDLGYEIGHGVYGSPTVGLRFGGLRNDFLVGVTYSFNYTKGSFQDFMVHAVGLKVGFEF